MRQGKAVESLTWYMTWYSGGNSRGESTSCKTSIPAHLILQHNHQDCWFHFYLSVPGYTVDTVYQRGDVRNMGMVC